MKPGKPLKRKTALKTWKPLQARSNLRSSKGLDRSKPIAPVSKKRKAEGPRRALVRAEVLKRDVTCRALGLAPGPCRSPFEDRPVLEVHEVVSRARWSAGYLDAENCLALCQIHHDWVTEHPTEATALGLLGSRRPNRG